MSCGERTSSSIAKLHLRSSMVEVNRTLSHLTELNAAINAMIEEVEYLRGERAAVVAWLRSNTCGCYDFAADIERGEHRREEEP